MRDEINLNQYAVTPAERALAHEAVVLARMLRDKLVQLRATGTELERDILAAVGLRRLATVERPD